MNIIIITIVITYYYYYYIAHRRACAANRIRARVGPPTPYLQHDALDDDTGEHNLTHDNYVVIVSCLHVMLCTGRLKVNRLSRL